MLDRSQLLKSLKYFSVFFLVCTITKGFMIWQGIKMGAKMAPLPPTVQCELVQKKPWEMTTIYIGSVYSENGTMLCSESSGIISDFFVEEGQFVYKGQLLVELRSDTEKAQYALALAELDNARDKYKRGLELFQKGIISSDAFDDYLTNLRACQANVDIAKSGLDKKLIKAPFDGWIGLKKVSLGELITLSQPVVSLYDHSNLKIRCYLPIHKINQLKGLYRLDVFSEDGINIPCHLAATESYVDPNTRQLEVSLFVEDSSQLRPGMFVTVNFIQISSDPVLVISKTAVNYGSDCNYVYSVEKKQQDQLVITPSYICKKNPITILHSDDQKVAVLGLKEHQKIVSIGGFKLHDGQPIMVDDSEVIEFKKTEND